MPSFLLVFSDDPPAADVVREDFIVSKTADNKCVFRWVKDAKKDPVGVPVSGRILREGMKKDMRVLKVDVSGTITQGAGLGTRKQELEKARLRAAYAQKHNLQELAENMLHLGIDELAQQLNPTKRVKRPKTPKKRNPAQIALVNGQLNNMPCFKNGPHKIEVWEGKGVYCPEGFLTTARLRYGLQPLSLFRTILRILFPTRFRLLDGASYSWKYCTVAVPPKLIESIVLYVQGVFRMNGGVLENIKLNPQKIVTNLISNTRKKYNMHVNDLPFDNLGNVDDDVDMETDQHLEEPAEQNGQPAENPWSNEAPPPSSPVRNLLVSSTPTTPQHEHGYSVMGPSPPCAVPVDMGSTFTVPSNRGFVTEHVIPLSNM